MGGGLGRRPGHRRPAARAAPAGARRLPRRRRTRARRPPGAPVLRARTTTPRSPSPTTSGARTCSARRCAGTWTRSSTSTSSASGSGPRTCDEAVLVSSDPGQHAAWIAERAELGFDAVYLHHVGQEQQEFIDVFGERGPPAARGHAAVKITDTSDLWWKTAVIYCLDVETFLDWDGDGTGDIAGLVQRIDYLAELGVTCLWLMPFYPTPDRDDGYDITDFYGVDPRLGNHGDFVELVRTARDRGMRVIVDLVVNHTSDRHPWFRSARSSRTSPLPRLVRVGDDPPKTKPPRTSSSPTRRPASGSGTRRPASTTCTASTATSPTSTWPTRRCATRSPRCMGFWLELGVSGFRVDAVPFLIETPGRAGAGCRCPIPTPTCASCVPSSAAARGDAILLGEVNLPHAQQRRFVGDEDGDELTMLFDFIGMQNLYLSLARARRPAARQGAPRPAAAPARLPVGDVRPQPRRAHPRQAHRAAAPGGVRRLRSRARHADLRAGAAPAPAADARRRPAPDPDGVQPAVLAPRHARAVLRRGDRHGRGARRRGPHRGAHDRCSGHRDRNGGFSDAPPVAARRHPRCRAASGPSTSTSRPAAGPGLAAAAS